MFRKFQRLVSNLQSNKLAKFLIVVGLVMLCLTPAEASVSKAVSYSVSFTNSFVPIPAGFSTGISVSNSASGTITITGPGGFSSSKSVSSLGSSSFSVTLGAAGTYTVNESYTLTITGSNALLGTIPPKMESASATAWTFSSSTPGASAGFSVSSGLSGLAVTSTSANISGSISGTTVTITTLVPIELGDSISITAGALWTVTTSASVTEAVGTVAVTTDNASATFNLTGASTGSGSGTSKTWTNMPTGSYTCTFGTVAGFTTPAPQTKTLTIGGTITFNGVYTPIPGTGTIVVTTNNASATFNLTGAATRSGSGTSQTWMDMPPGSYTCTFNVVAGFNTPTPQTKTLVVGGTITFNGVYTAIPQVGTVAVTTNNASATFNVVGPADRSGSGTSQTWTDMPDGSYTCTFSPIAGFNTPAPQAQTLGIGATITFNGIYTPISQTGTVVVTTNNAAATFDLTGAATRSESGTSQTWTDMPPGSYTCTFSPITGFNIPAPQTKTLVVGGTITFNGVYTPIPQVGTVAVTTNNASATFDVVGPADRSGSGTSQTWTNMPTGSYTCTFNAITGYITPPSQTQTLAADGTITLHGQYTAVEPETGTVVVQTNLKDDVIFTVTSPDYTEADFSFEDFDTHRLWALARVATGDHTITYGDVPGYDTPASETLTLAKDSIITFVGDYTRHTGTVQVQTNLKDDVTFIVTSPYYTEADFSFEDFGTYRLCTLEGVPTGDHTITYDDVPGYDTPASETLTLVKDGIITFVGDYTLLPPQIKSVDVSGSSAGLGGVIIVVMSGDSGHAGTFSIESVVADVVMTESVSIPGLYTGEYAAQAGDNAVDAVVRVKLTNSSGASTSNDHGRATIDATPPEIDSVSVSGSPARKVGDVIKVVLQGEPGGSASFFMDGIGLISMTEISGQPGDYEGSYTAVSGLNISGARVVASLTDGFGNTSVDESQSVSICTLPWDINRDGIVDVFDIEIVSSNIGKAATPELDLNGDGIIDMLDLLIVTIHYGETCGGYIEVPPGPMEGPYTVTRVVDGDTIKLDGFKDSVRYIGIDTPETVHPSKPVEPCGQGASQFNKELVEGKEVMLEFDVERKDRYNRILAYVYLTDGTFVNAELVKQGHAVAYPFPPNTKYAQKFAYLEREASEAGRGCLWVDGDAAAAAPFASQTVPDYLFQNYPNPSNPGTWIPFMLADGNDVAVSIYSSSGQLVRRLNLGYKDPGVYVSKEQGVYWDGSTEYGEEVASGVYFYHIKAGDFSAVRKMLIAR